MYKCICILLILISFGCASPYKDIDEAQPNTEYSVLEKTNIWIYNYMNHYYLYREDLPDYSACDFELTPTDFFNTLISDKDRFSYISFPTYYNNANYGFAYQKVKDANNQEYMYVLYTTSQDAKQKGISRGTLLRAHDFGNTEATFDICDIKKHPFTSSRSVTLKTIYTQDNSSVYMDSIYNINGKKIGYLCYLEFDKVADFTNSLRKFSEANIDELILDLRYNPGGYESTCKLLCNSIVNSAAYGDIFVQHSYNNLIAKENMSIYGNERTFSYYSDPQEYNSSALGGPCPALNMNKVYILTSQYSASCSELTIISLRAYMEVIVIGENTTGKGVGMQATSIPNFKYAIAPITFRFFNVLNETVPDNGITPNHNVSDGYFTAKKELGETDEPLLQYALNLITGLTQYNMTKQEKNFAISLVPVGEPSFVTEHNHKYNRYEN